MAGTRSVDAKAAKEEQKKDAEKVGAIRGSLRFHLPDGGDSLQYLREGHSEGKEKFQKVGRAVRGLRRG
jgi:hypothetical protein